MSNSQPIHFKYSSIEISGIFSSIPIQHFSDVTTLSSIHLVRRIQRRNLYVVINMTRLLHKYGPPPSLDLTTRRIFQSNRWVGRRCCTRSFLLKSYCLPWLVRLFFTCCLWSSFANVDVSHYVLFMSNRHLVIISVPGSIGTSPAPRSTRALFLSLTRSVSAILSLYAFILAFPVKVLSLIILTLSRHSSFYGFVALPCDARQPPVFPWASMSADET